MRNGQVVQDDGLKASVYWKLQENPYCCARRRICADSGGRWQQVKFLFNHRRVLHVYILHLRWKQKTKLRISCCYGQSAITRVHIDISGHVYIYIYIKLDGCGAKIIRSLVLVPVIQVFFCAFALVLWPDIQYRRSKKKLNSGILF